MKPYHKIQTLFKRDPHTNYKTLLEGQYSMEEFKYLRECAWAMFEKVDGTNIRIQFTHYPTEEEDKKMYFSFYGKTNNAQLPLNLVSYFNLEFDNKNKMNKFKEVFQGKDVCLYGEGYGGKIQNGTGYRQHESFILFDVRIGHIWLDYKAVQNVAQKLDIACIPLIGVAPLEFMVELCRNGFDSKLGKCGAEGVIAKPIMGLNTKIGQRIITKLKVRDFK